MNVSIYNLVLEQDFNPIKVPRHREFKPRYIRRYVALSEFTTANLTCGY